ncbi:probable G-protein coupled receptor 34 [Ruditapes philippinarum]|uniref:probable G-protein coupled receptor 34 n=1 Tax=Ruditapes philippinarum TaxID=129788 RepID=UPI00295B4AA1|nr:probable G-protein coupled receptor 34 [Ruditapes philippinarum]XP_060580515.1 probable G-protein coupled receptor 34 [Ruditapes philippinarum]
MEMSASTTMQATPEDNATVLDNETVHSNTSDMYDYDYNLQIEGHTLTITVISIILSLIGLLANSLAIIAIINGHRKRTTHLKLVISLCCSDALILLSNVSIKIIILTKHVDLCLNVAMRLTTNLALIATLLNLLGIATDHYLAIIKPMLYKKEMTSTRGLGGIGAIWIISLFAIGLEIISGLVDRREKESPCVAIAFDKTNSEFAIVAFIFAFLLVIIMIYARIYICVIRRQSLQRRRHQQKNGSGSVKTLITTSLFVLTFVLFLTPIGIFNVYIYFQSFEYTLDNLDSIAKTGDILYVILLLNTISDPIIYAARLQRVHRQCCLFPAGVSRLSTRTERSSFAKPTGIL